LKGRFNDTTHILMKIKSL